MPKQTPSKRVLFVRSLLLAVFIVASVFATLLLSLRAPERAHALTSSTLNFQARLESSSGAIAADGNYNVEFKLYSASSGGTALWTEDHYYNGGTPDQRIRVVNGYLTTSLASITAFPSTINWDQQLWVTMNIGGNTTTVTLDGEMSPRLQLTAVPYALSAGQLQTTGATYTSKLAIQAPTVGNQTFQIQDQGAGGTFSLLAANQSTGVASIGTASSLTGILKFYSSANTGSVSLSLSNPGTNNFTLTIPTLIANDTICTVGAANCSGGSGVSTVGALDGGTANANGATISGTNLYLQSASASFAGVVNTGAQTFAGAKTFNNGIKTYTIGSPIYNETIGLGSGGLYVSGGDGIELGDYTYIHNGSNSGNALRIGGTPTNTATTSVVQIGSAIAGGNVLANGGTYLGLNAPSTGAGSAADFLNFQLNGVSKLKIDNSGNVVGAGFVDAATGFKYNGTTGTTATCSGGQFLQNQVVQGGITTGGTCTTAGGGITTIGTLDQTGVGLPNANGAAISGSTLYLQSASASNAGLVNTTTQSFAGNKTFTGTAAVANTSTTAFQIQTTGGAATLLNADTTNGRITVGSLGTSASQLFIGGTIPSGAIGSVATGASTSPHNLFVQGNYAYVINNTGLSLAIYDVSKPSAPVSVGSASTGVGSSPQSVYVQGRYAYVADYNKGLLIYDVSNHAAPTLVGSLATTKPYVQTTSGYNSIYVSGRYAYIAGASSLYVVDVSKASAPALVGSVAATANPYSVTVQGNYAYVANNNTFSNELQIFDISNPASPVSVGFRSNSGGGGAASGVFVQGRYGYEVDDNSKQVYIEDLSNPPTTANSVGSTLTLATYPTGAYMQGHYLYVVLNNNTIAVVDITNPTAPVLAGTLSTGYSSSKGAVFAQGRYLYTVDYASAGTLKVFDMGGAYIEQLEVGGAELHSLSVDGAAGINGDTSIQGGLVVGESAQITGDLSTNGAVLLRNATNTANAFQVQTAGGVNILGVDTSVGQAVLGASGTAGKLLINGTTNSVSLTAGAVTGAYSITLPTTIGTAGQCLGVSSVASGNAQLGFSACGGSSTHTKRIVTAPEYPNTVFSPNGTNNSGYMTSNFVSGLTAGQGYKHNYYQWTTDQATAQNYDIVAQYQLPSDFSSFASGTFKIWTYVDSLTSTGITWQIMSASGASCYASAAPALPSSTGTWQQIALSDPGNGCSFAANDVLTIDINVTAITPTTNTVRVGDFQYDYNTAY